MLQNKSIEIVDSLFEALCQLKWSHASHVQFSEHLCSTDPAVKCWLERLQLSHDHQVRLLSPLGESSISRLIENGFQLFDHWPSPKNETVEQWLGKRLYLGKIELFASASRDTVNAIVSSQLGRGKNRVAFWPTILESAIRKTAVEGAGLLLVGGTTLYESTKQFARAAGVVTHELILPEHSAKRSSNVASWLHKTFSQCLESQAVTESVRTTSLFLSPELQIESDQDSPEAYATYPLQDRVAIALANRVIAVSVRPGGKIAELLTRRLSNDNFPAATVFVCMPCYTTVVTQTPSKHSDVSIWLDQGAVGFVVMIDDSQQVSICCRCKRESRNVTLQSCYSLQTWLTTNKEERRFLTHCTRGNSGPLPQESIEGFYRRIWNEGQVLAADPFLSLTQILIDGRLRGSTWLTRGSQPTVSLSGVDLPELLSRRKFRSHLGRWDWEPYGLLFDQQSLGLAKPVIYGSRESYADLPLSEQAYFQPANSSVDWSVEKEWRVIGDIDLRAFPTESVTVFTRFRAEAHQLASHSPFPVMWIED